MKFPWHKYEELSTVRRNTLQIFITPICNLECEGCFVRGLMSSSNKDMSVGEYERAVFDHRSRGGEQINILGGEPFLHPNLIKFIDINKHYGLKTTIYTNGYFLDRYSEEQLKDVKIRVSIYSYNSPPKAITAIRSPSVRFDPTFMVSKSTIVEELLLSAEYAKKVFNSDVFFISSIRELDNPRQDFFDDTAFTMPLVKYKELVHEFLTKYDGDMEIHVSKRGVFESTKGISGNKCRFSNYFIGGKIIQCPYDIVNKKFQDDYKFDDRFCQHNSTCLMSKVVYRRK